eukprot:jgi/Bigna1/135240/aug1.28_g9948
MHLSLRSPNLVECTKGCEKGKHLGNFTMTYDEGMEIQMPDMVFYAFFKYTPKSNVDPEVTDSLKHYDSDCSKTRTGWIHEQAVKEKCVTVQDTLTADQPALLNGEIDVAGNYSTTSEPRFRGKVSSRTSKACLGAAAALVEKAGAGVQQTAILEVDQNARFTYDRDHIDTSFYNQGCSGGYPYLVGKHGKDLGFRTVKCYQGSIMMTMMKSTEPNDIDKIKISDERHFIKGYGYVGGYYGGGNMESIMREIHDKGPVIAAFEPSGTFFSYKSGIFTGAKGPHTDDWEKTDHAIVLIGWGETTDGVKYWIGKK